MTLSEELKWRGFVNQTTLTDIKSLDNKKWIFYHGFDASADSQTVGNLAAMMLDRLFMRHGAKAYLLAGGATSLIGDPGGKDIERPLQDEKTVAYNIGQAEIQLKRIFKDHDFTLVNNLDWFKEMSVLDFFRDVGKHFSMTPLVQREYIAARMGSKGSGISFTEFSYTLLQGYDYLHLHEKYGINLQLSGSDQWGNCLSGVELVRKVTGDEVHALTMPLIINKSTGKKFGKSEAGAIWLDADKTSPDDFYQFWVNTGDDSVSDYLKIYTELSKEEIAKTMKEFEANKAERSAQHKLAYEVTSLVHGQFEADNAKANASALSSGDLTGSKLHASSGDDLVELLVKHQLASSNTEARRLLDSGGVYINNRQTSQPKLNDSDFANGLVILRRGKSKSNSVLLKQK